MMCVHESNLRIFTAGRVDCVDNELTARRIVFRQHVRELLQREDAERRSNFHPRRHLRRQKHPDCSEPRALPKPGVCPAHPPSARLRRDSACRIQPCSRAKCPIFWIGHSVVGRGFHSSFFLEAHLRHEHLPRANRAVSSHLTPEESHSHKVRDALGDAHGDHSNVVVGGNAYLYDRLAAVILSRLLLHGSRNQRAGHPPAFCPRASCVASGL